MDTYTYTEVKTRAEAVVDQVEMFLQYAGIQEHKREMILKGVHEQWLTSVAVFLERNGKRFLEAEISVNWDMHAGMVVLTPMVRQDLPGWENGAAPEVRAIGRRFGAKAKELKLSPRYWVRFRSEITRNDRRYRELCPKVGVSYESSLAEWEGEGLPAERKYELLDLSEVQVALREARR